MIYFCCYKTLLNFNFYMLMHWNKRLFTHPWPTVYMYFYTTRQNMFHQRSTFTSFPWWRRQKWSPKRLDFYPQLTRLVAREDFIEFSRRESFKSYLIHLYEVDTHQSIRHLDNLRKKTARLQGSLAFLLSCRDREVFPRAWTWNTT
jgi:hypothetical protein